MNQTEGLWLAGLGLLGAIFGSFMNVVTYRLPLMLTQRADNNHPTFNLWLPSSHCPRCHHKLAWYDNIPLLSWLLLKGQCRYCKTAISPVYLLTEVSCALGFVSTGFIFPPTHLTCALLIFFWFGLALSLIDARTLLLPDALTFPLLWIGLVFNSHELFVSLREGVYGAVMGYLTLWGLYWLSLLITHQEGLGYGDIKLMAAIGAWCGWQNLPTVMLIASASGLIVALWHKLFRYRTSSPLPFGPHLAFAGWVLLLWLSVRR